MCYTLRDHPRKRASSPPCIDFTLPAAHALVQNASHLFRFRLPPKGTNWILPGGLLFGFAVTLTDLLRLLAPQDPGENQAHITAPSACTPSLAYDSTSSTHVAASVRLVLPTMCRQPNAEQLYAGPPVSASLPQGPPISQPSIPPGQHAPVAMEAESNGVQMYVQSNITLMRIKDRQGNDVQIPVDVEAGSRVANEKRKRNAGASARSRAKKKDMARLEQELLETVEELERCRAERDHLRSIVGRHHTRPPSPYPRRLSFTPSNAPSSGTGAGSAGSSYSPFMNVSPTNALGPSISGNNSNKCPF
ncbi:hypothetical protein P154DRAFT_602048 [Amniculicola lignicola CBS 123094]|uniref:BZIP domain-containing protein n=1 Tax=Amniculicola lignicola CBS 123094 TaxID=1392246 RepID=A0A6A5WBY3_9PLEO|nr:hypothetical protein P154DRAFT_602048 [Amniculicola lignicola CBS 123094]